MELFTIGPVEMYESTLNIRSRQIPYFRTTDFSKLNLETDEMLKRTIGTSNESKVIYLTASGTAAMEATVMNCLDADEDYVLVIEGGTFGKRFAQICEVHGIKYKSIKLSNYEELTLEHLSEVRNEKFTALLVNLHETSTGQLYDVKMLSEFCKSKNMLFIVDAISTFLCDNYEMDNWGIDATIISSQKGLCVAPGMSMVVLNEKILSKKVMNNSVKSIYFNFKDYIINMERGQTPFTPAVGIMYEINDMLRRIDKIGLDRHLSDIDNICKDFRHRIEKLPVSIPKFTLSNAITPVIFEKEIATYVYEQLVKNEGIYVNPSGGEIGKNMFRVAHVGNHVVEDNERLVKAIEKYL